VCVREREREREREVEWFVCEREIVKSVFMCVRERGVFCAHSMFSFPTDILKFFRNLFVILFQYLCDFIQYLCDFISIFL
jgi:hypothetical protein